MKAKAREILKEEPRKKRPWRRVTEELKNRVGQLMKQGLSDRQIAQAVDRDPRLVRAIIKEKGGVFRIQEVESGLRLSLAERDEIFRGLLLGWSFRQIARQLGRAPSTVTREVNHNGGRGSYRPSAAHARAQRNRLRPRAAKLCCSSVLRDEVVSGLEAFWSPKQISLRLEQDYPDALEMRVSPETIYQSLFVQARGALRADLTKHLRTGRTHRRSAPGHLDGRGRLKDMIMISERPAEADDRAVPGHWEGDLIIGRSNRSAIGTLVERWSRFVMLLYLPDGFGSEAVLKAVTAKIQTLPRQLRRSLTWDQGKEMTLHADFTLATDMQVYFCDPHSPWQRGSNENTNGLLRQFFPKGTDLSGHSEEHLDHVAELLNGRPRETLGWRKPCEKFAEAVAMAG
jgi:IS30 family transposase